MQWTDRIRQVKILLVIAAIVIFYFGSLAAVYELFTPEQVGCKLETLWSAKIDALHPKATTRCVVSKQVLYRKKQKEK